MNKITTESTQKIFELQQLINNVEIKGMMNISIMYKAMTLLQEITRELQKSMQDNGITVDNTKEEN